MKPLNDLLKSYMHKHPMAKGVDLTQLLQHWPSLLGPYLADRIRPVRFDRGILVCEVSSAALIQEFSFLQREILSKLRLHSGGELIRSIQCVVQAAPRQQNTQQLDNITAAYVQRQRQFDTDTPSPPVALWEEEQLRRYASHISDDRIREKAQKFMHSLMQRQKYLEAKHWPHCDLCQTYFEPIYSQCPYCHLFIFDHQHA